MKNLLRVGVLTKYGDRSRLSSRGRAMRDAYQPLCELVENRWRHTFGSSLIDKVIDAVRVDGHSRPFPLVAWTGSEFSLLDDQPPVQDLGSAELVASRVLQHGPTTASPRRLAGTMAL